MAPCLTFNIQNEQFNVANNNYLSYLDISSSSSHQSSFGVKAVQTERELELLVQQNEDADSLSLEEMTIASLLATSLHILSD